MKLAIFQKLLLQTLQALQCSLKLIHCNSKTAPRSADLSKNSIIISKFQKGCVSHVQVHVEIIS